MRALLLIVVTLTTLCLAQVGIGVGGGSGARMGGWTGTPGPLVLRRKEIIDPAVVMRAKQLLLRSYDLAKPYPAADRARVLQQQAAVAVRIDDSLGRDWAEELFNLAASFSPSERTSTQMSALMALAEVDPERALALHSQWQPDARVRFRSPDHLIARILTSLWLKRGESALPMIRENAAQFAATGRYPYEAMAGIIAALAQSNSQQAQALFADGVASYSKAPSVANEGFSTFLASAWRAVPAEMVKPALSAVVENLLQQIDAGGDFYGRIMLPDKVIEFRNSSDVQLLSLMAPLRELDPQLLQRVVESRPELKSTAEGQHYSLAWSYGPDAGRAMLDRHNDDPWFIRDPDKALAAAEALVAPERRAEAFVRLVTRFAYANPQRARDLLQGALEVSSQVQDRSAKLNVLADIANHAAMIGEAGIAQAAVDQGFALARASISQPAATADLRTQVDSSALDRLMFAASAQNLENALARVGECTDTLEQARLLTIAAEGLLERVQWDENRRRTEQYRLGRMPQQQPRP